MPKFKIIFNKRFSIIELMTVILVILLLITLMLPTFTKLKMNAKSALCKGQMHKLGVLITTYLADNSGYLPNDAMYSYTDPAYMGGRRHVGDIPRPSVGNASFYANWNGHLLPYMDVYLPDKYTRYAMVTKVGTTRFASGQLGGPPNAPPSDILKNGWAVVDDAFMKGGYQDLRNFICPEIHQNAFDVAASIKFNGVRVPRIQQLCTGGVTSSSAFRDAPGYDYGMSGGIPTTYLANNVFFGEGVDTPTLRIDQIANVSNKAFILEGGLADAFGDGSNGAIGSVYYGIGGMPYDGGDLTSSGILYKSAGQFQKLSYVHDDIETFWVMNSQMWSYYFPSFWMGRTDATHLANKFNVQFAGKASMVSGTNTSSGFAGFSIVSYVDPLNGKLFEKFFIKNPPGQTMQPFTAFDSTPNEYKYLTGYMNVLFGDGSVLTKEQGWLCNNRRQIGALSAE